jgi:mono/diheme cytochrome c family protein
MRIALPLLALVAFTLPAIAADEAQLIVEGKRLAEINCTRCHNIEATGESSLTDAPPFREIAKNYDRDELLDGFMEGLAVRHPLMPDWDVTEPQAEALTVFVLSLGSGSKQSETDDPNALEEALAEGIVTGHNDMPEFAFEPGDVTAIITYLDTLKAR